MDKQIAHELVEWAEENGISYSSLIGPHIAFQLTFVIFALLFLFS